jgi:esterase/lipase superfamily enzyme
MPKSNSALVRGLPGAVLVALSLASCTARPGPDTLATVRALPSGATRTVEVYTVTTRSRETPDRNIFGAGKSPAPNYARMMISIPPGHKASNIEWPKGKPDPKKSFAVVGQSVLDRDAFLHQVKTDLAAQTRIGLFVHGYNTNYQESVFRLAQLSTDADVKGMPVLFSWPSQGALAGYVADKEAATYSRDDLADLLLELTRDRGPDQIYVFAHSMGGWLLVEALRQLKLQGRDDVIARLNVILAAPDIDADVFRTQMRVIGKMERPMTILVSADDRALAVSGLLSASSQRVGTLDVKDPRVQEAAVAAGVKIIDISTVAPTDSVNHARFADIADLYPALTARPKTNDLGQAGAFVFDAAAMTVSSPFRLVSKTLSGQ